MVVVVQKIHKQGIRSSAVELLDEQQIILQSAVQPTKCPKRNTSKCIILLLDRDNKNAKPIQ